MYSTGISDLRALLSDGPTDRYNYRKQCFGYINSSNVAFKTFDFRRITDFTDPASTGAGGVYLNGNPIPVSGIAADNLLTGEFMLVTAPVDGDLIEASYYNQWFLDDELNSFLQVSSRWVTSSTDYSQMPDGLVDALLKFAASEAYLKMAIRWRTYLSQGYKVEDSPKDSPTYNTDSFTKMAEVFRDQALKSRDEYYTRQGRKLQPLFGSIPGGIRNLP